ncbi:MAG: ATP-binding cassette domain-containing protein [Anaerolineae bacterium]|nr:ATP-binding cassette domain-containing protein [Anaerolineae bacterium]
MKGTGLLNAIIQVDNIVKKFRGRSSLFRKLSIPETIAVDHISFVVPAGEFVGYLGPNGAGKSTTIKMLAGLLVPTSGSIHVNGLVPWRDRTRYVKQIGVVFGQRSTLWWDLPLIDSLELIRHMYDVPLARYKDNLQFFSRLLDLDEFLLQPVRTLSLGQRMRAELSAALLFDPKILFLDEPTIGLDIVAKDRIRTFLADINQRRETTIILTTHDLSDVEKLCRSIMIIDHGQIVYGGSLAGLAERVGGSTTMIVDVVEEPVDFCFFGVNKVTITNRRLALEFLPQNVNVGDLITAISQAYTIRDIEFKKPSIESIVMEIYGEAR